MNNSLNQYGFTYRFDFDVGYLVKSPCRDCDTRPQLPRCSDNCEILDRIQAILAETVSCTSRLR